jgi:hypothetical protein
MARGKKGCFKKGTMVSTPDGQIPIEKLEIGDYVLGFDKNGNVSKAVVTNTFQHDTNETDDVMMKVSHDKGELYATDNHWFLCENNQTFKEIKDFNEGENIVLENGSFSRIESVIETKPVDYTYNITVTPHHTFIADGVRVHNKGGGKSSRTPVEAPNTLQSIAFVRIVDLISEGEIEGYSNSLYSGLSIYFDDTPLGFVDDWNFSDVYSRARPGTSDQDPLEYKFTSSGTVKQPSMPVQISQAGGAITKTISDSDVDAVRLIFTVPALLEQNASTGDINPTTVQLKIEIDGGGGYQNAKTVTISGKCTSTYQRDILIRKLSDFGSAPYSIRVSRLTADSASAKLQNETYWNSYVELIYEKLYYPNSAIVAIEARADQFNSVPERKYEVKGLKVQVPSNYNPDEKSYVPPWNGTFKASKAYTNNPVWCLYDLLRNDRYGYGLTEDQIDKASFYSAAVYCDELVPGPNDSTATEPRFTFNTQIQSYTEAFYIANLIASSFRGMLYWSTGKVFLGQDRPGDPIINVTNASIVDGIFNYISTSRKDRHTQIAVTWNDPDDYYRPAVEFVDDRERINRYGIRRLDTNAFGCTSRGQAIRWGRWILDTELNQTETVQYVAGLDHVGVVPGDIVSVTDENFANLRYGGRVVNAVAGTITLDDEITIESGETYEIQCTLPNGTIEKKDVTNIPGDYTEITYSGSFTELPNKESVWQLIASDLEPRQFRVVTKTEVEPHQYRIEAVIHDPNKYARVEQNIYVDDPIYTTLPDSNFLEPPSNLDYEEYQSTQGTSRRFNLILSWDHSPDPRRLRYEVQDRLDGFAYQESGNTTDNSFVFENVLGGLYHYRVRAVGLTGKSNWVTLDNVTVVADTTASVNITGLQIKGGGTEWTGTDCEFEWDEITLADEADFRDYKVEILDSDDNHLRFAYPIENSFIYTYNMNLEDNATPQRTIKVRVWCRDIYDSLSIIPAAATFTNPAPVIVGAPEVTDIFKGVKIDWTNIQPTDPDGKKFVVYLDTTAVFPITQVAEVSWDTTILYIQNLDTSLVYYCQIEPYDEFGPGTKSSVSGDIEPLKVEAVDIDAELTSSITMSDSLSSSAEDLSELYDRNVTTGGITYANTDWVNVNTGIEMFVDGVRVYTNSSANIYFQYRRNGGAWKYLGGTAAHELDSNGYLTAYATEGEAQTNYLTVASGKTVPLYPQGIIAIDNRINFLSGTTLRELIFIREVIAEQIVADNLAAISANVGVLTSGIIQSNDGRVIFDLDVGWIKVYDAANTLRVQLGKL